MAGHSFIDFFEAELLFNLDNMADKCYIESA